MIDARFYGLEHAGLGRYTINLISQISKLDHENKYTLLLRKKYFDSLNLPSNFQKVLAEVRHYSLKEQILIPQIIDNRQPDIVHFPHLNIPLFWKGKFVLTLHDLTMQRQSKDATTLPLALYYAKRVPFLLTARKAVKGSVKIIVPSQTVKKEVVDFYKIPEEKIVVIYEGMTDLMKSPKRPGAYNPKEPYFIYVGNAYPHKNLKSAIEAVALLNKKAVEKITFAIGGSRSVFSQRLTRLIADLKAEKYVRILGGIPDLDLGVLYKNSLAYVYPSLSEGFGLQGLEAMSAGTLVLASDIPVFREIYGDNAIYFDPRKATSITEAMKKSIEIGEKERARIINRARQFSHKYSWKKMAESTLQVYRSTYAQKN